MSTFHFCQFSQIVIFWRKKIEQQGYSPLSPAPSGRLRECKTAEGELADGRSGRPPGISPVSRFGSVKIDRFFHSEERMGVCLTPEMGLSADLPFAKRKTRGLSSSG